MVPGCTSRQTTNLLAEAEVWANEGAFSGGNGSVASGDEITEEAVGQMEVDQGVIADGELFTMPHTKLQ